MSTLLKIRIEKDRERRRRKKKEKARWNPVMFICLPHALWCRCVVCIALATTIIYRLVMSFLNNFNIYPVFLFQAESRAEFAERSVQKLQKEVDRLEGIYIFLKYKFILIIVSFLFLFLIFYLPSNYLHFFFVQNTRARIQDQISFRLNVY